jgi:hypothetical protein
MYLIYNQEMIIVFLPALNQYKLGLQLSEPAPKLGLEQGLDQSLSPHLTLHVPALISSDLASPFFAKGDSQTQGQAVCQIWI